LALTLSLSAQVETKTTAVTGSSTVVTRVDHGEIVSISGNDLVIRMADGTIQHFASVPVNARVTVGGKQLGIADLKPGMKLQRTITTTATPMTITTVQSVKGKVWAINPPVSIILTLEDGKNQQFKIPENQKFDLDGQMIDAFAVRKGMIITATKVTEVPSVQVTQSSNVTGKAAPTVASKGAPAAAPAPPPAAAPAPPPANVPVLVAVGDEEPVPAAAAPEPGAPSQAAEPAPALAPEPASGMPKWLTGLLILVVLAVIIWWFMRRKNRS
jgi:hypothetical protein